MGPDSFGRSGHLQGLLLLLTAEGSGGQKLLSLTIIFLRVFGDPMARTGRSLAMALGLRAWEVPRSSPFVSAASFPPGKGTGIDYLFEAGGSG